MLRLAETSWKVSEKSSRNAKVAALAELLREADDIPPVVSLLMGDLRQGKIGVGYSAVREALRATPPADETSLTVAEFEARITDIAEISGAGSKARRERALGELLAAGTEVEREFIAALLVGELRQGALEGVMVSAVAEGAGVPLESVRRALMFHGDLPVVADRAFREGKQGLARLSVQLFRPLKPMLAQPGDSVGAAMDVLENAALEFKLDGARVQVHRDGDDVRIFTRKLNEVTDALPEVVERVRRLPGRQLVLDGEVIALSEDGRPEMFQTTMRRFGRTENVAEMVEELPLSTYFFDCLYLDGDALVDEPGAERWRALQDATGGQMLVPRVITTDRDEADRQLRRALDAGHEGLVAKALDAPYEAGRRGKSWFKIKPVYTLDLVILAAEWGSGRRKGKLSNLHLGARDPETGGFVMLGKTFKGLTDEMLAWQTEKLLALKTEQHRHVVHVRPELVAEIAFDGVQDSPRYPGGLALRFARVKAHRPDKSAAEADTIDLVRAIRAGTVAPDL